jgi:phosphoenolpyruvate synthase/pyruvate phosphate dikinase
MHSPDRHHQPIVAWLGDEAAHDPDLVGGKAAALSRLAAAFPVPPGFVVTTAALRGDAETYLALAEAYAELALRTGEPAPRVAVRSSAVAEDGAAASFAGQYETFLNVQGEDELLAAVERCWDAAASQRVHDYREAHGLPGDDSVAVLVQQLVPADVSAVVFSADPVQGGRDIVVVNASWGLGESIVGGTVTPDTIYVRRSDLSVAERHVAEKTRMTVPAPRGTREVDVPVLLRRRPVLTDEHAAKLAQLAVSLEAESGRPVDIEAAFSSDTAYVLQARPITTLAA